MIFQNRLFFIGILVIFGFYSVQCLNLINFIKNPSETIIPLDSSVEIQCLVNIPNADYSWVRIEKDQQLEVRVTPTKYISLDRGKGILTLSHHSSVVGSYRCKVDMANIGVIVSRTFSVKVAGLYKVNDNSYEIGQNKYKIGDVVVLKCPFYAIPVNKIQYDWYLKPQNSSNKIKLTNSNSQIVLHKNGQFLETTLVHINQFGAYKCRAKYISKQLSKTSKWIDVQQIQKGYKQPISPDINWSILPENSFDQETTDASSVQFNGKTYILISSRQTNLDLLCSAVSIRGPISIQWFQGDFPLSWSNSARNRLSYKLQGKTGLQLSNLTELNSGEYSCQATQLGHQNMTRRYFFQLKIQPQLRFINKPSPIIIRQVNKEVLLTCKVNSGVDQLKVEWRKNGAVISTNNYLQLNGDILRISKLLDSDEGVFQCFVNDGFNSISAITQLKINKYRRRNQGKYYHQRLKPVDNLIVRALQYRKFNITWTWSDTMDAFNSILYYDIILLDLSNLGSGESKELSYKASKYNNSYVIENLPPDHFYRIFVFAVNASGKGYPAIINSSPRVLAEPPSKPPTNIRALDIGSGVVTIIWTPPPKDSLNGELRSYQVVLISQDALHSRHTKMSKSPLIRITGLTQSTEYEVKVQAVTRGGRSPFSHPPVLFTTKENPNTFDQELNANNKPNLLNNKIRNDLISINQSSVNKATQKPAKIRNIKMTATNSSFKVTWTQPSGPTPQYYKISWGKYYPGPSQTRIDYPLMSFEASGLDTNRLYILKIVPINSAGAGVEALINIRTENKISRKIPIPLNVKITRSNMHWALLSWEDPSIEKSTSRLYQIRMKTGDSDYRYINVTETTVQLEKISPNTDYEVSVRTGDVPISKDKKNNKEVFDMNGLNGDWIWSEWSMKEYFTTPGYQPSVSPTDIKFLSQKSPIIKGNQAITYVTIKWKSPYKQFNKSISSINDPIVSYNIFFTNKTINNIKEGLTPSPWDSSMNNWDNRMTSEKELSATVSLTGFNNIFYFRFGCVTKNYKCPFSRLYVYRTTDKNGKNFGELFIPNEYYFNPKIPQSYLTKSPIENKPDEMDKKSSGSNKSISNRDKLIDNSFLWIIIGVTCGMILLIMIAVITIVCYFKQNKADMNGYKIGKKSAMKKSNNEMSIRRTQDSNQGTTGLLLSNQQQQSPTLSNGKLSPGHHYMNSYGSNGRQKQQILHTPDLFSQVEQAGSQYGGTVESDSNPDNDSLRFASVSQHHLASTAANFNSAGNMMLPPVPQDSLLRRTNNPNQAHLVMSSPNTISSVGVPTIMPPPPIQFYSPPPNSTQQLSAAVIASQYHHPYHPQFTTSPPSHFNTAPHGIPAHIVDMSSQGHSSAVTTTTFSNTPRVNASELISNTSSEDIRPLMIGNSRLSENDMTQYYLGAITNNNNVSSNSNGFLETNSNTVRSQKSANSNPKSSQNTTSAQQPSIRTSQSVVGTTSTSPHQHDKNHTENTQEKGFSTEELSQEMANLEGLMKDLNAITQKEFEC